MRYLALCLAASALVACGDGADPAPTTPGTASSQEAPSSPGVAAASNAGGYHVSLHTDPLVPPLNEEFEVRLELRAEEGGALLDFTLDDVEVDARMPAHGHGMNVEPALALEDGVLVARGMLFHMIGHWELYVDLEQGPITERAQFDFNLR